MSFERQIRNTIIEIIDEEKYSVEVLGIGDEIKDEVHNMSEKLKGKMARWGDILWKKIPMSRSFGKQSQKLKLVVNKQAEEIIVNYKYNFCAINEDIKMYVHAKEILGFSFFVKHKLYHFETLTDVLETYLMYAGQNFVSKVLADTNRLKTKKINSSFIDPEFILDIYVIVSKGFSSSISLSYITFNINNSTIKTDIKLPNNLLGANIDRYILENSETSSIQKNGEIPDDLLVVFNKYYPHLDIKLYVNSEDNKNFYYFNNSPLVKYIRYIISTFINL